MAGHPIRVTIRDDRRRSRLTVFFRALLVIPHLIWLALWSILAVLAGIANWVATLATGTPPSLLHRFLSAYVRYTTQLQAYLFLAANPYPGFEGAPGYPVDVEIDGPARQNRWLVGFRLLLALPALGLAGALLGTGGIGGGTSSSQYSGGVAVTVAFLAWFACLVRGRMPRGFRDLVAYGLRYGAQASAYLFVLTDRYPDASPAEPAAPDQVPEHPVRLRVDDDLRRSRLTVFFRLLLAVPHIVWILLWGIVAFLAAIVSWVATLARGTTPAALHRFLAAYVRYEVHVYAFLFLAANPFPGFTGAAGYPLDGELPAPERQNRWTVGFRGILAIPVFVVGSALGSIAVLAALYGWFVGLALGRMPRGLRDAVAYTIRYRLQTSAYVFLLTERYPDSGPLAGPRTDEPAGVAIEA